MLKQQKKVKIEIMKEKELPMVRNSQQKKKKKNP